MFFFVGKYLLISYNKENLTNGGAMFPDNNSIKSYSELFEELFELTFLQYLNAGDQDWYNLHLEEVFYE